MNASDLEEVRDFSELLVGCGEQTDDSHVILNTREVCDLVRNYPQRARKYVILACRRAAEEPGYLRSAAIVAVKHDKEFMLGYDDDSLLKLVVTLGTEAGIDVYRELLTWALMDFT